MITEVYADTAFTYETPPGCDPIPVLDAYDGCLLNCPYCFQLRDKTWKNHIDVKVNIVEVLKSELGKWPKDELVCIGSRSDPYMSLAGC